jgi:O-antigen ligase
MAATSIPAARIAPAPYEPGPVLVIGFASFCFYVFAFYSRFFDQHLSGLHLPGISNWIALLITILSGRLVSAAPHRIVIAMLALTAWLCAATVTSFWQGGSYIILKDRWLKGIIAMVIASSIVITIRQCRRCLFTIGIATATGTLLVSLQGEMSGGRLAMGEGTFGNSNAVAVTLLLGLPCLWLMIADSRANKLRKLIISVLLVLALLTLARTGSREGMIGLITLCMVVFFRASLGGKVKLIVGLFLVVTLLTVTLPRSLKQRYLTTFQGTSVDISEIESREEAELLQSAAASTTDRWNLLLTSLRYTIQHPVFGLGPGQFAPYTAEMAKLAGRRTNWNSTHNTYTQVSSEAGIPALAFFVAALVFCFKDLNAVGRRARQIPLEAASDISKMTVAMQSSFIAYATCAVFSHTAYELTFPLMAGLAAALSRAAAAELPRLEAEASEICGLPNPAPGFNGIRPWSPNAVGASLSSKLSAG